MSDHKSSRFIGTCIQEFYYWCHQDCLCNYLLSDPSKYCIDDDDDGDSDTPKQKTRAFWQDVTVGVTGHPSVPLGGAEWSADRLAKVVRDVFTWDYSAWQFHFVLQFSLTFSRAADSKFVCHRSLGNHHN